LGKITHGIQPSEVMNEQGLEDGDKIIAVDGQPKRTLEEVGRAILIEDGRTLTIERNGARQDITLHNDVHEQILDRNEKILFLPRVPFIVDSIVKGGNAEKSGAFQKGDRILAVNDTRTPYFRDFVEAMQKEKGRRVMVQVQRGADAPYIPVEVDKKGKVGLGNAPLDQQFTLANERYDFLASIPAGVRYGVDILGSYVTSLKLLFSSAGVKQVGGFGSIGGLFGEWGDWQTFWETTAMLSIILAFMNILPIPALDGGHVVFLLYEMVARRPANQKVLEVAQMVGMFLLLALLLLANGNDVMKWFSGKL
jgi:regulator of sigma E protease